MTQRCYTLDEIDAMRDAVFDLSIPEWIYSSDDPLYHRQVNKDSFATQKLAEARLRTYLMAGIEPADIIAKAKAHIAKLEAGKQG